MKIENYKILLNFISLTKQDFEFIIYRKENKGEKKEDVGNDIYFNTLPFKENSEERKNYWISFSQKEGFEKFFCIPEYNIKVAEHYLYYCLMKQVKEKLDGGEYLIPKNKFRKLIYLILKNHPEGNECLLVSPYYLKSDKKFGFLIDFKFIKERKQEFNRKVQQLSLSLDKDFKSNSNYYIDKYSRLEEFKTKFYSKIFPLQFDNNLELESTFISTPAYTLKTKTYIVGNSKESNSQFMGIRNYGPYKLLDKPIYLLFFFKTEHKVFASDLAKSLKGEMFSTFDGIVSFFKIPNIKIKGIEVKDNDFTKSIKIEIENKTNENFIPIIILFKNENELYYEIKYEILKNHKMAVQFVSLELLKNKESLKWSVSNIGLQIFSKLGGIPWLVKSENKRTLIIGLAQSHKISLNNGRKKITRYFAYSVLTDSSGIFKEINSIGKCSNKEEYLQKLSNFITNIVNKYANDYDNFVIHCPFKIRRFELEEIKETLKQFNNNNHNKHFVVLKINTNNKYFGFNSSANSLVPYENTYLQLSEKEFLIWFEGLQYHNPKINKRISGPTHIEFYYCNKDLTINDKKLYLQDVLNLSGVNWRGFNSKSMPISIHYTRLVSKFIQHFSKYDEIKIENINPWFL